MNDARFQLISLQTDNFIMRTGYTIQLLVKHLDCGKITITPIYCIDYYEDDEAWLWIEIDALAWKQCQNEANESLEFNGRVEIPRREIIWDDIIL